MEFVADNTVNKLILLFVLDKMEIPLTEISILEICSSQNNWINYMDCKPIINQLIDHGFICSISSAGADTLYSITPDGRVCLADFFINIPSSPGSST